MPIDLAYYRARVAELQALSQAIITRRGTPVFGSGHKIIGNIGEDGVFHPAHEDGNAWITGAHHLGGLPKDFSGHATDIVGEHGGPSILFTDGGRHALQSVFGAELTPQDVARLVGASRFASIRVEAPPQMISLLPYSRPQPRVILSMHDLDTGAKVDVAFTRRRDGGITATDLWVRNEAQSRAASTAANGHAILHTMLYMQSLGVTRVVTQPGRNIYYMDAQGKSHETDGPGRVRREENGYYTWARLGFTGKIPAERLAAAQAAFGKDVTRVEQLMQQPGGARWWKTHGVSWRGAFDLTPNSYSMQVLTRFLHHSGEGA